MTELAVAVQLDGIDLAETRRAPLTVVDSVLRRCDLTAAVWQQVTLRQTELLDCRALGLRLSVDLAQDGYAEGCRFDHAVLRVGRVRGLLVFAGCDFTDAVIGATCPRSSSPTAPSPAPSSPRPPRTAATCAAPGSPALAACSPCAAPGSPPTRPSPSPPASPPRPASPSPRTD